MKSAKIIKIFTIILCAILIIGSIVIGIIVLDEMGRWSEGKVIGISILIGGPLLALIDGAFLYGYANIIDNTHTTNKLLERILNGQGGQPTQPEQPAQNPYTQPAQNQYTQPTAGQYTYGQAPQNTSYNSYNNYTQN